MTPRQAYLLHGLKALLGVALLCAALSLVDVRAVRSAAQLLSPGELLIAFTLTLAATIIVPAIVTHQILGGGRLRLSLGALLTINLAMRFYVLTLPHAVTVGIRWMKYRRANPGLGADAAAQIIFERTTQFLVLVASGFVFLLAAHQSVPTGLSILLPLSGGLTVLGAVAVLTFTSAAVFSTVSPLARAAASILPKTIASRVGRFLSVISDFQRLSNRHVAQVLVWAVIGHILWITTAFVVVRGLDLGLGFAQVGWMRSVVFLLTVLPITVGGLGIREAGFGALLYLHGVDGPVALTMPLVLLALQLAIGFVGAVVEGVSVLRSSREAES